jgi:DNA end-binding protein Ku
MFEKPYYLVPTKAGRNGYVLLRKVLEETKKAAVARFVMRAKEHLVAVIPRGPYLILETLRFAREVREVDEATFLEDVDIEKFRISPKELKMAEVLVSGMTSEWRPEKYKDTYQVDLLKFFKHKIKKGDVEEVAEIDETDDDQPKEKNVVDLMPLLQKSLLAAEGSKKRSPRNGKKKTGSHTESVIES